MNSSALILPPGSQHSGSSLWVYSCEYLLSAHKHHFISSINFYSVKKELKAEELFLVSQLQSHISVISRVTRRDKNYRDLYVHPIWSGCKCSFCFVLSLFVISFLVGIQLQRLPAALLPRRVPPWAQLPGLGQMWDRSDGAPSQPYFFSLALLDHGLRFLCVRENPTF